MVDFRDVDLIIEEFNQQNSSGDELIIFLNDRDLEYFWASLPKEEGETIIVYTPENRPKSYKGFDIIKTNIQTTPYFSTIHNMEEVLSEYEINPSQDPIRCSVIIPSTRQSGIISIEPNVVLAYKEYKEYKERNGL